MAVVRPLAESDVPEAQTILRRAFGTFLGAPDPENFWPDLDYVAGRFGGEHVEAFGAEDGGALVGSNFATRWGSVGFFGPLSIRPDRWDGGDAQPLVAAACEAFDRWHVSQAGLFTFAHSAKHVHLYGKFGFHPRFLTAIMVRPARAGTLPERSRYAALSPDDRRAAEGAAFAVTDAIYDGLDLRGEIRTVAARNLGDTLLLWEESRLAGFAVCHCGAGTEAGADNLFVKFGAVRSGPGAETRFAALLDAAGALAAAVGMKTVVAGVNLAREEAYRQMKTLGFRTAIQGVAMHRGNEPGYCRPGVYALDDWR
jgi:hypothetical protein